jgi:hypothetical protein
MEKEHVPLHMTMDLYRKETGKSVRLCYNTLIRGADGGRSRAEVNAAKS